jgi:hypothetical protein
LLDKTLQVPLGRHRNRLEFQLQAFRQFEYNVLLFGNAPNHTINENRSAYSNETIVQTKSDDIKNLDLIPLKSKKPLNLKPKKQVQTGQQHLMVCTTMIYTHTIQSQTIKERVSPLDFKDNQHNQLN